MEDTRTTPTADSMRAEAQQITQAQDADKHPGAAQEPPTVTPSPSGHLDSIEAQDAQRTPGRKRKNNTSTQARNAYNNRTYDRIEIRIPKGQREQLQAAAAATGQSTSAYIINAINAAAGREIITPLATNPYI